MKINIEDWGIIHNELENQAIEMNEQELINYYVEKEKENISDKNRNYYVECGWLACSKCKKLTNGGGCECNE
jgi:hypothetical protein